MSVATSSAPRAVLGPDDLRVVAQAFEDALQKLPEAAFDLKPFTARQLVARYVIERALAGEREFSRLRDGALQAIGLVAAAPRQEPAE
jgi:hypothetical protein